MPPRPSTTVTLVTRFLGGAGEPDRVSLPFVDEPFESVVAELVTWRRELGQEIAVSARRPFPALLEAFLPLQAPWTRELLMPCGPLDGLPQQRRRRR